MKILTLALVSLFAFLLNAKQPLAQTLKPTDLNRLLQTGSGKSSGVGITPQIQLNPGVYTIGDDDHKLSGTHYLIVDSYINEDHEGLALMISAEGLSDRDERSVGKFYKITPIRNGRALMLSPIFIDSLGNYSVQSELNRQAQVIEITRSPEGDKFRYPYVLQGHYGALNGGLFGMRADCDQNLSFRTRPSSAIFSSELQNNRKLVVSDNTLAIHSPNRIDERYQMLMLNGDLGKIAALVKTEYDTMAGVDMSSTRIEKLAFFMTTQRGVEVLVIGTPALTSPGSFNFEFYSPRSRTFLDYIAKGKLSP